MLFIGDIHIHHRQGVGIIQMLRQYISQFPQEKHVIFVGDYVYHFNYHRPSLLLLFDFFLELFREGKTVYILAWNHDWIGQHFVYEEARRMLTSMRDWGLPAGQAEIESMKDWKNSAASDGTGESNIYFITEPQVFTIEWERVLMLPYMLNRKEYCLSEKVAKWEGEKGENTEIIIPDTLQHSSNVMEVQSWYLNNYLAQKAEKIQKAKQTLMIVHHYYIAQTKFPWLKVQFQYKDLALSPYRLQREDIKLLSWHVHHTFSYHNYLCIGAVWSTRPTEYNRHHYLRHYDAATQQMHWTQVAFNPYLELEERVWGRTQDLVQEFWSRIHQETEQLLQSESRKTSIYSLPQLPRDRLTLSMVSSNLSYEKLELHVDSSLQKIVKELKLKRSNESMNVLEQERADSAADFRHSWSDWKILLDNYLQEKFTDRYPVYDQMVKKLGIG